MLTGHKGFTMRRRLMRMFGVVAFGCMTAMALAGEPVPSKPAPPPDWLSIPPAGITFQEGSKLLPPLNAGEDKASGLGIGTLSVGAQLLWLQPVTGSAAISRPHVGTSFMWEGSAGHGIGWDLSYHGFGR